MASALAAKAPTVRFRLLRAHSSWRRSGLLDGHRVATHWDACRPLAATFPAVTVDPDALYVVDGRDLDFGRA